MLAGVGAIDACLFVVAATEGWKPQSEEHLRILELLGIGARVVALTKADAVDAEWLELATLDVHDHVSATFLEGRRWCPWQHDGQGLDLLRPRWTTWSCPHRRARPGPPRLWVDRVFAAKGVGTVVTGTLTGGGLSAGDQVVVGPAQRPAAYAPSRPWTRPSIASVPATGSRSTSRRGAGEVARGDAVIEPGRGDPPAGATPACPCSAPSITTSPAGPRRVIGSGEHPVKVRVLAGSAITPGTRRPRTPPPGPGDPVAAGDR